MRVVRAERKRQSPGRGALLVPATRRHCRRRRVRVIMRVPRPPPPLTAQRATTLRCCSRRSSQPGGRCRRNVIRQPPVLPLRLQQLYRHRRRCVDQQVQAAPRQATGGRASAWAAQPGRRRHRRRHQAAPTPLDVQLHGVRVPRLLRTQPAPRCSQPRHAPRRPRRCVYNSSCRMATTCTFRCQQREAVAVTAAAISLRIGCPWC
jgi:hypothetical protein